MKTLIDEEAHMARFVDVVLNVAIAQQKKFIATLNQSFTLLESYKEGDNEDLKRYIAEAKEHLQRLRRLKAGGK